MLSSTDNIIKLAWSDKVSFEEIKRIHGLSESEVIKIMRKISSLNHSRYGEKELLEEQESMKKKEISPRDLLNWMIMFRHIILFLFFIFLSSQSFADQNDKRLNRLFDKLIVTEDQLEIEKLTQQIWKIWHEIDDPRMTRAFETGVQMMNLGFHSRAIDYFDKVIMEIPNFAEAWNKRATAHFMMGNFDLSMRDISKTLELEPRHFGALDGMGLIFIHLNQPEKAIDIYDKMLEIFPNSNSTKMKKDRILSLTTQST